jgi:hypothetical protein
MAKKRRSALRSGGAKTAQYDDMQTRTFLERIPCIVKTFVSNV